MLQLQCLLQEAAIKNQSGRDPCSNDLQYRVSDYKKNAVPKENPNDDRVLQIWPFPQSLKATQAILEKCL